MLILSISSHTLTPILRSHGWAYLAPFEITDDGFLYPTMLGSRTAVTIDVEGLKASLRIEADRAVSPAQQHRIRIMVEHMLSLDFPLHEFQAMCRKTKARSLLRLANKGWGRMLRSPTFWEDAVKTLCTTNASWGYTEQMCQNLCLQLGATTPSGLKTFPLPEKVLKAGERYLKDKVGMGYRSKSLMLLAEKAVSGVIPWLLDVSVKPDVATAEKEIRSWHGFGPYATKHLLVLMGFHEYLPIDREVGTHLGIRKPGDKGSDLDSDHFEDWGKFRFTAYKLTRVASHLNWIGD